MTRREVMRRLGLALISLSIPGGRSAFAQFGAERRDQGQMEMIQDTRVMLGNVRVQIKVFSSERLRAREGLSAAFSEAARLENLISFFKPESVFSRINAASGKQAVEVPPEIMALIRQSLAVTRRTEGAFNLALGPAMRRWGFLGHQHVPTQKERLALEALCHPENIVVDEARQSVFLRKKGMQMDAGGIGKGFIAQRMKAVLKDAGLTSGMIALSGDLAFLGTKPDGRPWRVGIRHPRDRKKIIASLDLSERYISTSGDYERFFKKNGQIYHHILDSENLLPARDCQSVTVISDQGAFADALSTGLFVMGPESGIRLLNAGKEEGMMIDREGRIHLTPSLERRVRLHEQI